jgi:hypothetical protein
MVLSLAAIAGMATMLSAAQLFVSQEQLVYSEEGMPTQLAAKLPV